MLSKPQLQSDMPGDTALHSANNKNKGRDFWLTVLRGMVGRCPCCGEGALFISYLKPIQNCSVCAESFGHVRADDGPAWLTIILVGHILGPLMLWMLPNVAWSEWTIAAFLLSLTLTLSLLILPRAKGFFIGLIWRQKLNLQPL